MSFHIQHLDHLNYTRLYSKRIVGFLIIFFGLTQFSFSQILKNVDEIFPFKGELAVIKKGDQWAFVNKEGVKVIDFRDDLVATKDEISRKVYPQFVEGKCLIKRKKNGVYLYGYIDDKGTTVIEPTFLNATNFKNGYALVIQLEKSKIGSNSILGKSITNIKLEEYVIDSSGKTVKYLENARGYIPTKEAPTIWAKFIAKNLVAVKGLDGKWTVHKF